MEIDNIKRQMLQQEIAFNIQQTDALTRFIIYFFLHFFKIFIYLK